MESDKQLKHWFSKYNRKWFNGELPEDTVVIWEPVNGCFAETCPIYEVEAGKFIIRMNPSQRGWPSFWKLTLLHEMCHLHLWNEHPKHNHGKVFDREMQRLALAGAFHNLW